MTIVKTASQTRNEIRAEIAPILAAWIERAQKHNLEYVARPQVYVELVDKNAIYWSARVEPRGVTQWAGFVIHSRGPEPARLGCLRDHHQAQDWARSRLTERQEDRLESEEWTY